MLARNDLVRDGHMQRGRQPLERAMPRDERRQHVTYASRRCGDLKGFAAKAGFLAQQSMITHSYAHGFIPKQKMNRQDAKSAKKTYFSFCSWRSWRLGGSKKHF